MSTATQYLEEPAVSLNGLQFGPGTPYAVVEFNPFRLRARADSQPRAWNHGSWSGAEWAEEVIVPLVLAVRADRGEPDCLVTPDAEDAWAALQQALSAAFAPVGDQVGESELRFTLGSRDYVMFGRPRLVEPDTTNLWRIARTNTQCAFAALDPRKYSAEQVTQSTGLSQQEGGLVVAGSGSGSSPPFGLVLDGTSGNYASTPDDPALDVTGDVVLAAEVTLDDWATGSIQNLVAKYDGTSNNRSYRLAVTGTGNLRVQSSEDGIGTSVTIDSTVAVPVSASERLAVRVWLDVNDGAGNHDAIFYTAPTIEGPWTQLGDSVVVPGTTSIFAGTAPLEIGTNDVGTSQPAVGVIHTAFVIDGNLTGTVVARPRFDIQLDGTTAFTDRVGRTWTVNGAAEINTPHPYRGGLTVPFTVGGFLVGGVLDLLNEGTAPAPLLLRIDGPVINPRVILQQPGGTVQSINFFDLTVPAGQWVIVSTASGTALLNGLPGSSVRGRVIWNVDPFPLLPGTTTVRFVADEFNDQALLTTTHRSAWW